ncbi:hypothetical protein ACIBCU_24220 [Streptomyces sp. NPDC051064]|uniref:hypothetical protein n=1 Tax=Streptomyces sp. NPDC051064 TaxID=3365641 RepID=UPI003792B82A
MRALLEDRMVLKQSGSGAVDALAGPYRSLTTGRRVLVLLDDFADTEQVTVLPVSPGSAALVSSRNPLRA